MKLLIAVPALDYVHADFVKSLIKLMRHLDKKKDVQYDVDVNNGTLVYLARDKLACKAVNENYDKVLWLDADMVFEPEIFDDLMDTGKEFVCGVFVSRRPSFVSCLFKQADDLNHLKKWEIKDLPKDTFELQGCGFACVMVDTAVLRDVHRQYGTCFLPLKSYGEDIAFCLRARKLGHRLFCEPTVRIGHIGHITIYPDDGDLWRQTVSNIEEVWKNA